MKPALYPVSSFPPMFNTADIVLLSIMDSELGVLLIRRKDEPYQGSWALPGGFMEVEGDEDILAAAKRELEEEAGIKDFYLEQLQTFTKKFRDPREKIADRPCRICSIAHYALIDYTKVKPLAGSDAAEVQWFKISQLPPLAFDHAEIIQVAINRVRNKINYTNVGFELVPKEFTIPELREVIEKVLGRELNPTNFRTKLLKLDILDDTGKKHKSGRGQPAPVYRLNRKKLQRLSNGETLFN